MPIQLKRAYDDPETDDGLRVLVERLWPRGLSKDAAAVDRWVKELAPSHDLRKWFGHERARWGEFRERYLAELTELEAAGGDARAALEALREHARHGRVTFVFAARETELNNATVLRDYLLDAA